MTPEGQTRLFGAIAGAIVGAVAGAMLESAGWAADAWAAIVLAVIGGVLGGQAAGARHRRHRRRLAEDMRDAAASAGAQLPVDDLDAVLGGFAAPRDVGLPSHDRMVGRLAERAGDLHAAFALLAREGRLALEPGVSTPVPPARAAAIRARMEAFLDRAALDGIAPGEALGRRIAEAVRPVRAGTAVAVSEGPETGEVGTLPENGSDDRAPLAGDAVEARAARALLLRLAEVEALHRAAGRMTRDDRTVALLAAVRAEARPALAPIFGDPLPPLLTRSFPSLGDS